MKTHTVKTWPEFFEGIVSGEKTAELRLNDRNYQPGDFMHHREFNPETQRYTGKETTVLITYMITNFKGLQRGYCILSIRLMPGQLTRFDATKAGKKDRKSGGG